MSGLKDFREAVRREAERTPAPAMSAILAREIRVGWRWTWAAAVAMALIVVGVAVLYERHQEQRRIEQERADAVLMQEVNEALSRSVPRAMSALWEGGQ